MSIAEISTKPGRGGRRPGAGRPRKTDAGAAPQIADTTPPEAHPGGPSPATSNAEFAAQRARHERIKADQRALALKIESGEYVSRAAVQQASATTLATLAHGLRGMSDTLERKGLASEWCEQVDQTVNDALQAVSIQMEAMCNAANKKTAYARA